MVSYAESGPSSPPTARVSAILQLVSERNVELTRGYIDAFNRRDIEAFIAYCDPSLELHSTFAVVGGVYSGHEGLRRWHEAMEEIWGEDIRSETEALFDLGEHTLAYVVLHGRSPHSSAEVTVPIAHLVRWCGDRAVYAKSYVDRQDALNDLGVSDDELEPMAP
jgi:hypothetical protein